ncbi:MAG TPA: DVUA0089 family protein, partial [Chthoniobacterales bacterium]|nr:DVUA0089 family protein [Chthoniobacterales bacterium]
FFDLGTASLDSGSKAQLAQISTRGNVLQGDNVMIGGFIISGATTNVIVRAIGPSLTNFGVTNACPDTTVELFDGSGTSLAFNDDWRSTQEQAIKNTGVPPSDDHESAIVSSLVPGPYTAIVRGKNNTTGVALVEVYGLP